MPVRRTSGPWRLAARRFGRNRTAVVALALLVALVAAFCAAPLWGAQVADTTAYQNHITDRVTVDGEPRDVVSLEGVPIGPTWQGEFFIGADGNGRDVMVRLLYAGRTSLLIGLAAALISSLAALVLGLVAGYYRGWPDRVISRVLDVIWSFPVLLLGVALGTALTLGGLELRPLEIGAGSKLVPIFTIGFVFIPYVTRPLRASVLSLREQDFVEAAHAQGLTGTRVMASELLPNVTATLVAMFALVVSNSVVLESALSFLGAGVAAPEPSWGTLMRDGIELIRTAPHLLLATSIALVLTVVALNEVGEGVRRALDPHDPGRAPAGVG